MPENPYAGTVFQDVWKSGFDEAFASPDAEHTAPAVLVTDQRTVFAEGALAGQASSRGLEVPADESTNWVTVIKEVGSEVREFVAHTAFDLAFVEDSTVGMSSITAGLMMFAKVAIWGPERLPFFDEAASQAVSQILGELQAQGATTSQNVELFMAACDQPTHGINASDPLRAQGWWHGRVFVDFDSAVAEAGVHGEHADRVRVLRFQSASPGTVDVIEL